MDLFSDYAPVVLMNESDVNPLAEGEFKIE